MVVMTLLQRMFLHPATCLPLFMSPLTRNGCGIYLVYGFNYKCTVGPYIPYIVRQQVGSVGCLCKGLNMLVCQVKIM